ncbi:MAG: DUF4249 domain-containing protein [Cyclobacteriaceae bacterium]
MKHSSLIILILTLVSCVERFEPNTNLDTSGIAVSGIITDETPTVVRIERTVKIDDDRRKVIRISGAEIRLYENGNLVETLTENLQVFYEGSYKGQPGNIYHIEADIPDYESVISEPQVMKPKSGHGRLFLEEAVQYELDEDGLEVPILGLNLNVNVNTDTISQYYRWVASGTYKFNTPDSANQFCYVVDTAAAQFVLGTSVSSSRDIISENLRFLESSEKFILGYSANVSQFAMNTESYDYWKKIDDQRNNVGSLFDSPPAQIIGNVKFKDSESYAPGFFEASSMRIERLFIYPSDFQETPAFIGANCGSSVAPLWCSNCLFLYNSSETKPSYWPE